MSAAATTQATAAASDAAPRASVTKGCPHCGSVRIRTAPLTFLSPVVGWMIGRKRYGCADCPWRGWKTPLQRRSQTNSRALERFATQEVTPGTSVLVIVVSLIGILLVSLQFACNPGDSNTNSNRGPLQVSRTPLG